MVETLNKRSFTQKFFNLGNEQHKLEAHIGHIHYRDGILKNGSFQDVDTTLNWNRYNSLWYMTKASYEAEIGLYGDIHFHNVDSSISFNIDNPNNVQGVSYTGSAFGKIGKAIIWKDIIETGAHQIVEVRNGELCKIFHFDQKPKSLIIDFGVTLTNLDFDIPAGTKPTVDKSLDLTSTGVKLVSATKQSYIRKAQAWNHRGETIDITLSFYRPKVGELRALKTLPKVFVDSTFKDGAGAWLECDTTTSYYTGGYDGVLQSWGNPYATIRSQTDSQGLGGYVGTTLYLPMYNDGNEFIFNRAYLPISTSGIGSGSTITSASAVLTEWLADNSKQYGLIQTTQTDPENLAVGDWDRLTLNTPDEGVARWTGADMAGGTPLALVMNATGRSWINKTGYTLLGIRDGYYDIDNNTPAVPSSNIYGYLYSSREAGTNYDPRLDVEYTEAAPTVGTPRLAIPHMLMTGD